MLSTSLYPEDFDKTRTWFDICDCLDLDHNTAEIHLAVAYVTEDQADLSEFLLAQKELNQELTDKGDKL